VQDDPSDEDRGKSEQPRDEARQWVIDYPSEPAETNPCRLRPKPMALSEAT
jgi:hypothetical protein